MKQGKHICNTLKQIRLDIARANGIKYVPRVCHHEGDCAGTCPACESEVRYLEREIARKRRLGKAAVVTGVSLGLMSVTATSCDYVNKTVKEIAHQNDDVLQGEVEFVNDSCEIADSLQNGSLKDSLSEITNVDKGNAVPRVTDLPIVGEVDTLPETFKGDSVND